MAIQAIVYSIATGRVRRVIDPQASVPNVIAFLAQAGASAGEAVLVYNKQGNGADTLPAWQAAVNAHTGLTPAGDLYLVVDAAGLIIDAFIGDPLCGDARSGCTLLQGPYVIGGTYLAGVYTPPVYPAGPVRIT